jgi:peroxiredoxin
VLESHPGDEEVQRLMHLGKSAYELAPLAAVQGPLPRRMDELRGRVVLLDFFASSCASCRLLAPELARLHERLGKRGLTVVGITSDAEGPARELVRRWNIPFAVGSDPERRNEASYSVSAIPALYVIDRKGVIREVMIGYQPSRRATLDKLVSKLLAER